MLRRQTMQILGLTAISWLIGDGSFLRDIQIKYNPATRFLWDFSNESPKFVKAVKAVNCVTKLHPPARHHNFTERAKC